VSVRELQGYHGVDEALLGAVVEVADDTSALLVRRFHKPHARRGQLLARFGVVDRVGHQLGEGGDPVLRAGWHRHARGPGGRQRTPDPAAEDDRPGHGGANPDLAHLRGDCPAHLVVVLEPNWASGADNSADEPGSVEHSAATDWDRGLVSRPAGDDHGRLRALDAE